ncbi:MAG TPA: hypothetical protein VL500_07905 [Candidatus Eisenbacteria bacterium]|nr:hypothetical protein [Candidatus Eisenbacteria bacterium]
MAFYGEMALVEEFIYRKLIAEIYRAVKGGRCEKCDLDHEPDDRFCTSCGDEIFPTVVYPIKVSGSDVGFYGDDIEQAKELARAWIDDFLDGNEPDLELELDDPPPDKKGRKRRRRQVWSQAPGAKNEQLLEQVRQLGWGKKALAILRGGI